MEEKNSDQPQNLVEKIPALDMILSIPTEGSQLSDQAGGSSPCFIMCIDASGRLLRIPMSVLQKQTAANKVADNHDKQKAPVATIAPWITSHNSHGNVASQVQHQSLSLSRHQLPSQQLFVDQARQINQRMNLGQQMPSNQEQETHKLHLIGSQQQLADKLQILMQKPSVTNSNVKSIPLISQGLKLSSEQSSTLRHVSTDDSQFINQCTSLQPQAFNKHQASPQGHSLNTQPITNLQLTNKHQEINTMSLQRLSFPQAIGQASTQVTNVPSNLNFFAVLQNNKVFQPKNSLQLLDQLPSQKLIMNDQAQQGSSMTAKEEFTQGQNWSNNQLLHDSKRDIAFMPKQNLMDTSSPNNVATENINGRSALTLNNLNIQLKSLGGKLDFTNKCQSRCASSELHSKAGHQASQQVNILQSPTKTSLLLSNTVHNSTRTNIAIISQANTIVPSDFNMQSEYPKDQGHLSYKVDISNNKALEVNKPEKPNQSQFILLENKGSPYLQLQASKYSTFPMAVSSVSVQCSSRSLESSFLLASPQVHFSNSTHQMGNNSNQIVKTIEGLRQVGNVQTIVIPNNISLNALHLPQINGLPLSNLSSIHIIPSSGLGQDQVLLLSSHSSPQATCAMVQTCTQSPMRQLSSQTVSHGKQSQNPVVVVQNPIVHPSVNQEYLRQIKNTEQTEHQTPIHSKFQNPCNQSTILRPTVTSNGANHQCSSMQPIRTSNCPMNNCNQFVVGQEYQLSYPSGVRVIAVWDGKYFKVKTPGNASVTPLKALASNQENDDSNQIQLSAQSQVNANVYGVKHEDAHQADLITKEQGHFELCKKCGKMCLNCEDCESCQQANGDNIPHKKIKLINDINVTTQLNNQQLNKLNGKRHKKITSRKFNSTSPKKDAEIVHILSSDDEQSHSSSWDDSNKTPNSPATASALCQTSTSLIPFSGFRVNIKKIFFGKISCDWMNTLAFDGKSVNLLSDSCSVSYSLSACGSEVMLVAAFFDANKHCTYLFLQVNHSSALKLFDRVFANSRSLYDPLSKDDCAKYIVLFLDDSQTNLMEVIPQVVESMQLCNGTSHPIYKTIENFDVNAFLKSVKLSGDPILQKESVIINRKCQEEECDEIHNSDHSLGPTNGKIINLFTYPPPPATGGITVTNEDLFCLNEGEFLNDVIIDFYLKYLSNELLAEQFKNSHIFSSFFYRRLTRKVQKKNDEEGSLNMSLQQRRHAHVKTWTRHVDLFSKDFIVVPINESAHWFLAIICYPGLTTVEYEAKSNDGIPLEVEKIGKVKGKRVKNQLIRRIVAKKLPCILVFDSLSGPSRSSVIKLIRDYLQVEWDLKKKNELGERQFNKDTLRGAAPECPQQTNFSDCGIYMLQYVQSFFTDPITDYTFPIKQPLNWFDEGKICTKRADLQRLILNMQRTHNPGLDFNPDQNGCIVKNQNSDIEKTNLNIV